MDENSTKPRDERDQDPGFTPAVSGGTTPLKRKVALGAAVALAIAGLGLGGAWVTGAFAPKPQAAEVDSTPAGDAGESAADESADNASEAPAADREKVEEVDAAKPSTGSDSTPSKSDSKPSSGSSSKPSHEHTWQAQYRAEPVHTTEYYTIVDQEAWDEQILSGSHYQFPDGYVTYDDADAWAHQKETHASYTVVDDYKTVHHEAVTH